MAVNVSEIVGTISEFKLDGVCVRHLHALLFDAKVSIMWIVMLEGGALRKFEKQLPLLVTVLYLVTGDYMSLIRHVRLFF